MTDSPAPICIFLQSMRVVEYQVKYLLHRYKTVNLGEAEKCTAHSMYISQLQEMNKKYFRLKMYKKLMQF